MTRTQLRLAMILGSVLVTSAGAFASGCSEDEPAPYRGGTSGSNASGGTSGDTTSGGTSGATTTTLKARATIAKTGASTTELSGTADFEETDGVTKVTVKIAGGTPGDHGLHIHANGSCDPVDNDAGLGAGGHWNPLDAGHALPQVGAGHMGDLGNITIGADGTGTLSATSNAFYVKDGPFSVVGKAVIYHAKHDDGTGPVGNAGARPGCGVIQKQ